MRRFIALVGVVTLWLGGLGLFGQQPAAAATLGNWQLAGVAIVAETPFKNDADQMLKTEFGKKIDLNNTNVRKFRSLRGFYPTLAGLIVDNAPYDKVEDVLSIPGLTAAQKEKLQANLDKFTVVNSADVFVQGDDRLNNGIYD